MDSIFPVRKTPATLDALIRLFSAMDSFMSNWLIKWLISMFCDTVYIHEAVFRCDVAHISSYLLLAFSIHCGVSHVSLSPLTCYLTEGLTTVLAFRKSLSSMDSDISP